MKLNKAAAEGFEKLESVNENEMYWVKHIFSQGDALLLIGDQRRIPIHEMCIRDRWNTVFYVLRWV